MMNMNTYQLQRLQGGPEAMYAVISNNKDAGSVWRVEWPTQVGGQVRTSIKWEARLPYQELLNVTVGTLPCFDTRREAAQFLADHVKVTR